MKKLTPIEVFVGLFWLGFVVSGMWVMANYLFTVKHCPKSMRDQEAA